MTTKKSEVYEVIYFKSQRDLEAFENYRQEGGSALAEDFDYPDEGTAMKWESVFIPERDGDLDDFIKEEAHPTDTHYILIHIPNCDVEVDEDGEWDVTWSVAYSGYPSRSYGELVK